MIKTIRFQFNPEDTDEIKSILIFLHRNNNKVLETSIRYKTSTAEILIDTENEEHDTEEKQ